jgi:hypothetical protein
MRKQSRNSHTTWRICRSAWALIALLAALLPGPLPVGAQTTTPAAQCAQGIQLQSAGKMTRLPRC